MLLLNTPNEFLNSTPCCSVLLINDEFISFILFHKLTSCAVAKVTAIVYVTRSLHAEENEELVRSVMEDKSLYVNRKSVQPYRVVPPPIALSASQVDAFLDGKWLRFESTLPQQQQPTAATVPVASQSQVPFSPLESDNVEPGRAAAPLQAPPSSLDSRQNGCFMAVLAREAAELLETHAVLLRALHRGLLDPKGLAERGAHKKRQRRKRRSRSKTKSKDKHHK